MAKRGSAVAELTEKEYWIGTLPGSPFQNFPIEDVEFQRFTEKVSHPDGALKTKRVERSGSVVKMEDEKAERIRKILDSSIVRGQKGRVQVERDIDRPLRSDEHPLTDFLYMMTIDEAVRNHGANWRESIPTREEK